MRSPNRWERCWQCDGYGKTTLLYSRVDCDRCEGTGKPYLSGFERLYYEYVKTPEGKRHLADVLREETGNPTPRSSP